MTLDGYLTTKLFLLFVESCHLFAHLEQRAEENEDALALGIITVMKQYYFVSSVYLTSDILPHLISTKVH